MENTNKKKDENRLHRWFFGVIKEFKRIQWTKKRDLLESLIIVIVVSLVLVGIFAAVDAIFLNGNILGG